MGLHFEHPQNAGAIQLREKRRGEARAPVRNSPRRGHAVRVLGSSLFMSGIAKSLRRTTKSEAGRSRRV
jgi:hypothetical protein